MPGTRRAEVSPTILAIVMARHAAPLRFTIWSTVFLLSPSRWLISRYDCPSPTSISTLGAKRSALTGWPGRQPKTTPRFCAAAIPERRSREYISLKLRNSRHRRGTHFPFSAAKIELQAGVGYQRSVQGPSQGEDFLPLDRLSLAPDAVFFQTPTIL